MSTPPIYIPITSQDLSGPGFSSATSRAQAFQASMGGATGSMKEARGAAMLFGEEVGIRMNRHLVTAMASSELLRGALTAAFPVVAAIGFIQIAEKIPDAIKKATDFFGGFTAASKAAMEEAVGNNEKIFHSFQKLATGYSLLATLQRLSTENQKNMPAESVMNGPNTTSTALGLLGPAGAVAGWAMQRYETQKKINEVTDKDLKTQKEIRDVLGQMTKLFDDRNKEQEKSAKAAEKAAEASRKQMESTIAMLNKMPAIGWSQQSRGRMFDQQNPLIGGGDYAAAITEPSDAATKQHLQDLSDMKGWYEATRTAAEIYATALEKLNALYADKSDDTYLRALQQINQQFEATDENTIKARKAMEEQTKAWKRFGDEVENNVLNAMFMKESWKKALESILEDLTKVIIKMYLLNAIKKQFNQDDSASSSGGGGFLKMLGSFFGGGASAGGGGGGGGGEGDFLPLASGGPAYAGMSYLVGEQGPELFSPRTSGSISPNGAFGRNNITYQIDARGADISVEQRVMRAIAVSHDRAVQKAVATVQERNLRR